MTDRLSVVIYMSNKPKPLPLPPKRPRQRQLQFPLQQQQQPERHLQQQKLQTTKKYTLDRIKKRHLVSARIFQRTGIDCNNKTNQNGISSKIRRRSSSDTSEICRVTGVADQPPPPDEHLIITNTAADNNSFNNYNSICNLTYTSCNSECDLKCKYFTNTKNCTRLYEEGKLKISK